MDCSPLLLGIEGPELQPREIERFRTLQPAGYILFSRNMVSAAQTRRLTDQLRELHHDDPIIAIDQEGGRVSRTKDFAPVLPSAEQLGATATPAQIAQAAILTGELLRRLGCNTDFAPVLDLDHHPGLQNSLRQRCWGRDPQRVIDGAGTWNRALRRAGILTFGKHFPACGRATSDPHHDLPGSDATTAELLREDIIPYTALMPELDGVMLAHVRFPRIDPDLPASLSPLIVRRLLRDQLGFDRHLVITDDLDMGAIADRFPDNQDVPAALLAGNDLALICHRTERADDAVRLCRNLPIDRQLESASRLQRFRRRIHSPLPWSDDAWQKLVERSAAFAETFPAWQSSGLASSPVQEY